MNGFDSPSFGGGPGGGFEFMFTLVPVLMVIFVILFIVAIIVKGTGYMKNSRSPRESRIAKIVAKRMDVQHHDHFDANNNNMHTTSSSTYYYITLEFDNGERHEYLDVKNLYGLVVEGDTGYAAIQGDWIVAFERNSGASPERARF